MPKIPRVPRPHWSRHTRPRGKGQKEKKGPKKQSKEKKKESHDHQAIVFKFLEFEIYSIQEPSITDRMAQEPGNSTAPNRRHRFVQNINSDKIVFFIMIQGEKRKKKKE